MLRSRTTHDAIRIACLTVALLSETFVRAEDDAAPPLATLKSEGGNRVAAAFSSDGRWFASGGDDRLVTVRAIETGQVVKVLQGHRSVVYNCEFSRDSRLLATGGLEGTVRIWDTATWRMRQALPHQGSMRAVAFSSDGRWIATGTSERAACIWEVETGRKLLELPEQSAWVMGVAFAPDGRTFYTATGSWNAADQARGSAVTCWRIEPSSDGLKATSLKQSQKRTGSIECLRITTDGQRLVTSGTDSQIVIWDPATLVPVQAIAHNVPLHRGTLLTGDKLFAAGDVTGRIGIWDLASKQRLRLFSGHTGHVFDVAAAADGEILASAAEDDTIRFWSATGRVRAPIEWMKFIDQGASSAFGADWNRFRGPVGNSVASQSVHPAEWAEDSHVAWKVKIPGRGWSQPVLAGDRVFVTTAVAEDEEKPKRYDGGITPDARDPTKDVYQWKVLCLSLSTGKPFWEKTAYEGKPAMRKHRGNTYASETPVTDGERVVAYFGVQGVTCYDVDGNHLWSKNLGVYRTQAGWGTASSPVIFGDSVLIQCDNDQSSFLVSLDKRTGDELWRVARDEKSNWSTPYI